MPPCRRRLRSSPASRFQPRLSRLPADAVARLLVSGACAFFAAFLFFFQSYGSHLREPAGRRLFMACLFLLFRHATDLFLQLAPAAILSPFASCIRRYADISPRLLAVSHIAPLFHFRRFELPPLLTIFTDYAASPLSRQQHNIFAALFARRRYAEATGH